MRIAVTGGTGFVGGHFIEQALSQGDQLNALTRREQDNHPGVHWVRGDLHDEAALVALCDNADAIVHIAGAISARDKDGFAEANIIGTHNVVVAAKASGVKRFLHVSSLAAREPELSLYGWSKAESERVVRESDLDWTIIRPPAVYGPGDRETLELFAMAARGLIVLPPPGRLSLIHVDDLSALLLACIASPETIGALYEPDDGRATALTHRDFGAKLGAAVGTRPRMISMPAPIVKLGARLDGLFRGSKAKLTPDRARYFCHPDWTAAEERRPPASLWQPAITAEKGLADTADWYRKKGWLS